MMTSGLIFAEETIKLHGTSARKSRRRFASITPDRRAPHRRIADLDDQMTIRIKPGE
ncbi:hypothetical protein [Bradyrhizobium japonicum]|uniref:hypothetical protein n=1 Tax=Bradyrhizobium japonicum TaxID=375 RepID=UPI001BA85239|nr:hypothetical protein [Bradyrhizobium japonicum]MBR0959753.1 hypothetical protein [Bradyrhizobium japonicum]